MPVNNRANDPRSKHLELLSALVRLTLEKDGLPPSHAELADALGVAMQTCNQRIGLLKAKGYIKQTKGVARSTQITDAGREELGSRG